MNNEPTTKRLSSPKGDLEHRAVITLAGCDNSILEEVSPSKNYRLCPWLDAKQDLNTMYTKMPDSPNPSRKANSNHTFTHIKLLQLKSARGTRPGNSNKENQFAFDAKTMDNHRHVKVVEPVLKIPTPPLEEYKCFQNTLTNALISRKNSLKPMRKDKDKVIIKWGNFQREVKHKYLATLPDILKNNFFNIPANNGKEHKNLVNNPCITRDDSHKSILYKKFKSTARFHNVN